MDIALSVALFLLVFACKHEGESLPEPPPSGATYIEPSAQRSGDADAGYTYLVTGDYVGSGVPIEIYNSVFGNSDQDLGRTGDNAGIPYNYTVVDKGNSVKVATVNCLNCHAENLMGEVVLGLGSNRGDYTNNSGDNFTLLDLAVRFRYGQNSPEWNAYFPASRAGKVVGPKIITEVRGPNPADKIFATLAAYRDKDDLTWLDSPQFTIPNVVVPTDVPAWWILKKKNALYYNALGRGDFGRLSMASGLLTMEDSSEARQIDAHFADVMAFIQSIEAPKYPFSIDETLAAEGKVLFENTCSKCHGTYGENETFPNYLIDKDAVGTDPMLAETYATFPQYHGWFNDSWFNQNPAKASLEPTDGYLAPPLDGIWATAPYLHNASVPTLEDLLNSSQRPTFWKRTFDNSDYNQTKLGWNYETLTEKADLETYDCTKLGYGNQGHTYGDALTDVERNAVLEYLKTL